ncbi:MAG: SgcJ/EcaC family oxidoreductase [Candidatus Melainabacteria bacterium]|nr:SgcJ/EcaC family oxidoreductase [Candidatus Melainabacteria bacterium]
MRNNRKAGLVFLTFTLALAMHSAQSAEAKEKSKVLSKSKFTETSPLTDKDDSVRSVLIKLEAAISSKKAADADLLFADDISFIDQSGEETRGRAALRERFEQLFKQTSVSAIGIHPQNISFPADNVALVVGEVSRKHENQDLPASRFSMVLARKNNAWQINQMTETNMQAAQAENRLQVLNWLIGEWSAEKPDASAHMIVEWAPSKKFITSKCTISKTGAPAQVDTQVIGWDPQHKAIISWHFDSNGGFGSGTWSESVNESKWTVDVAGVGADGSNTMASNVFTVKAPDEFVWQSIHRSLEGATVADTEAITVHRAKR